VILSSAPTGVGYIAMPAKYATQDKIAFMARCGAGVVSVVLTAEHAKALGKSMINRSFNSSSS
jgi:3,4-dihydroxy-2-butanone 4-phosphate synthase